MHFFLMLFVLSSYLRNLYFNPKIHRFAPIFSIRSFSVLALIFCSMIHFYVMLVYNLNKGLNSSCECGYPVVPTWLVVIIIFSLLNCLSTFIIHQFVIYVWVYFWAISCFTDLLSILILVPLLSWLDYCNFTVSFESR